MSTGPTGPFDDPIPDPQPTGPTMPVDPTPPRPTHQPQQNAWQRFVAWLKGLFS